MLRPQHEMAPAVPQLCFFLLVLAAADQVAGLSPNETKLIFYYGPEFSDSVAYDLTDATKVLQHPNFVNNKTHCYLHGFREYQQSESIGVIVDAYYKRKDINILALDWAVAASDNYATAALRNVEAVAPLFADAILDLFAAGLQRESFTVVAHSLGAQLAGMTGRKIIAKTNGTVKLYEMAVLDPAYPLYFNLFSVRSVSKNDAEFLQTIHTDIGTYGQPRPLGHVDFWPNGGRQGQPGCPQGFIIPFSKEDLCSHQRSWRFWAESVADVEGPEFWSFPAPNYEVFLVEGIQNLKDKAIQMGINCPRDARGDYYLKTNSEPPFAMGFVGY